ncbi:MAG: fasciclin domain-containing protein [Planctomycetota bacterium]
MRISRIASVAAVSALAGLASAQCGSKPSNERAESRGYGVVLASDSDHHGHQGPDSIVEVAQSAGTFNTLIAAVQAAGLAETLMGEGPFTVFAPSDEAFAKLPAGTVESLLKKENLGTLRAILTYHVVPGRFTADDVSSLSNAATANGQRVDFAVGSWGVRVDNARVVTANIEAENGIIHVIDSVIMPETQNIVGVADAAGSFSTLIAAAKAAGLAGALSGEGPLTVLAPTDEAFQKLPRGTVASLLKPENRDQLAAILKLHVIPGRVYSDQALAAQRGDTLNGQPVTFRIDGGTPKVNGATILTTDIEASNGVIHVIDTVLIPG